MTPNYTPSVSSYCLGKVWLQHVFAVAGPSHPVRTNIRIRSLSFQVLAAADAPAIACSTLATSARNGNDRMAKTIRRIKATGRAGDYSSIDYLRVTNPRHGGSMIRVWSQGRIACPVYGSRLHHPTQQSHPVTSRLANGHPGCPSGTSPG